MVANDKTKKVKVEAASPVSCANAGHKVISFLSSKSEEYLKKQFDGKARIIQTFYKT